MTSDALEAAERRTREVLLTQPDVKQLVVDSPPGAGKTGVVERLAVQGSAIQGERVMIATQTNAQSFDLAERLARGWPRYQVFLFVKRGLPVPPSVAELPNLKRIRSLKELPQGPAVVIANASKWGFVDEGDFDLLIVDEAYQLRDSQFVQIAGLADRHILVGDPGQIAPVVSSDVSRWQSMVDGPHVPAPKALLRRRPHSVLRMTLPVSRRLPEDSVEYVQPSFYPNLDFVSTSKSEDRRLEVEIPGNHLWDSTIGRLAEGQTMLMAELPERLTGEFDLELSGQIAEFVSRLLSLQGKIIDDSSEIELTADHVGVVCAHRSQVYAVQEALGPEFGDVYVETAERYQGLERRIMVVHHPLSGRVSASDFQLDVGRLCVMLSRHRVACLIVCRGGLRERLSNTPLPVDRILGVEENQAWEGQQAQRVLLDKLDSAGRIVTVSPAA